MMRQKFKVFSVLLLAFLINIASLSNVSATNYYVDWTNYYSESTCAPVPGDSVVDGEGNIYVTGLILYDCEGNTDTQRSVVVKYDNAGNKIWSNHFDYAYSKFHHAGGGWISLDSKGNVYVMAPEFGLVKYDASGTRQWERQFISGMCTACYQYSPSIITVAPDDTIYIAGLRYVRYEYHNLAITKYDGDGNELWYLEYKETDDFKDLPTFMTNDSDGNLYITGSEKKKFFTIKYDKDGNYIWHKSHNDNYYQTRGNKLAIDSIKNVIVTGIVSDSGINSCVTVKYDPNGNELWQHSAGCLDVVSDNRDNVYVTGHMGTFKYDPDGNELWSVSGGKHLGFNNNDLIVMGMSGSSWGITSYDTDGKLLAQDSGTSYISAYSRTIWGGATGLNFNKDNSGNIFTTAVSGSNLFTAKNSLINKPEEPAPPVEEPTPPIEDPTPPVDETPDPPLPTRSIEIDILPGNAYNAFNLKSGKAVPVVVLTTADFNAADIDPSSVAFGPAGAGAIRGEGSLQDVDNDGDLDAVFTFKGRMTGLTCDDNEATLSAKTSDGQPVSGIDSIGRSRWCK